MQKTERKTVAGIIQKDQLFSPHRESFAAISELTKVFNKFGYMASDIIEYSGRINVRYTKELTPANEYPRLHASISIPLQPLRTDILLETFHVDVAKHLSKQDVKSKIIQDEIEKIIAELEKNDYGPVQAKFLLALRKRSVRTKKPLVKETRLGRKVGIDWKKEKDRLDEHDLLEED